MHFTKSQDSYVSYSQSISYRQNRFFFKSSKSLLRVPSYRNLNVDIFKCNVNSDNLFNCIETILVVTQVVL